MFIGKGLKNKWKKNQYSKRITKRYIFDFVGHSEWSLWEEEQAICHHGKSKPITWFVAELFTMPDLKPKKPCPMDFNGNLWHAHSRSSRSWSIVGLHIELVESLGAWSTGQSAFSDAWSEYTSTVTQEVLLENWGLKGSLSAPYPTLLSVS